jgi:hypothetical protein
MLIMGPLVDHSRQRIDSPTPIAMSGISQTHAKFRAGFCPTIGLGRWFKSGESSVVMNRFLYPQDTSPFCVYFINGHVSGVVSIMPSQAGIKLHGR